LIACYFAAALDASRLRGSSYHQPSQLRKGALSIVERIEPLKQNTIEPFNPIKCIGHVFVLRIDPLQPEAVRLRTKRQKRRDVPDIRFLEERIGFELAAFVPGEAEIERLISRSVD
jgi:hypothetical protein